jgi:hypothetical protein
VKLRRSSETVVNKKKLRRSSETVGKQEKAPPVDWRSFIKNGAERFFEARSNF